MHNLLFWRFISYNCIINRQNKQVNKKCFYYTHNLVSVKSEYLSNLNICRICIICLNLFVHGYFVDKLSVIQTDGAGNASALDKAHLFIQRSCRRMSITQIPIGVKQNITQIPVCQSRNRTQIPIHATNTCTSQGKWTRKMFFCCYGICLSNLLLRLF